MTSEVGLGEQRTKDDKKSSPYVAFSPVNRTPMNLTDAQRRYATKLVDRFVARTAESKRRASEERGHHADNRAVIGLRYDLKEARYPLVADHGSGARMWDVDGNEYVDIAMGQGALLFGHAPEFVAEQIMRQVDLGMPVGWRTRPTGEAAALLCELTGYDRATFMNSGTESVMTALRIARAVTGRPKIVQLAGSYHGSFDGTLMVPDVDNSGAAMPMAPGVPPGLADDTLICPHGSQGTFEMISERATDIAAVLVEPIQSRHPSRDKSDFLRDLRQVTAENDVPLIFDEVISGLRVHPRGVQGMLDIRPDMTIYGKALGSGLPIGAVAGSRRFMDAVDGGSWQYGDDSMPTSVQTFAAGTFWKHPMVLAGAIAVLKHLVRAGSAIQQDLNDRTAAMVARLNRTLEQDGWPIRLSNFGSLFRVDLPGTLESPELFWLNMLERGVYTWEGRTCFLSTAHTDEDIETICWAVQDSAREIGKNGFL